jgi:hypothetical protein
MEGGLFPFGAYLGIFVMCTNKHCKLVNIEKEECARGATFRDLFV